MSIRIPALSTAGIQALNQTTDPLQGTAIPGDPSTDPDGIFGQSVGLNLASSGTDYSPKLLFRAIEIRGGVSGQSNVTLNVAYKNGSSSIEYVTVPAYGTVILEAWFRGIYVSGTTAINVFPYF